MRIIRHRFGPLARSLLTCVTLTACGDDDGLLVLDGAVDAPMMGTDAAPTPDAPAYIDGAVGVSCGAEFCAAETEKCCVNVPVGDAGVDSGDAGVTAECVPAGATCSGNGTVECDGPEDCADGRVCCGRLGGGNSGQAACETSCTNGVMLCHNDGDCPAGVSCCPIQQLGTGFCNTFTSGCPSF